MSSLEIKSVETGVGRPPEHVISISCRRLKRKRINLLDVASFIDSSRIKNISVTVSKDSESKKILKAVAEMTCRVVKRENGEVLLLKPL